ncbi:GerAB/ArcD/ProY family transporter [Inediibacterium massiliense]|uniref:GerAB/ArcD/ProY family transporter n=1 Tax=Inediibacterium massiliense TaxID=1658111 RepID=UPI0006B5B8F5|nr:endospore germination permease [Inediibacterium massiliense]
MRKEVLSNKQAISIIAISLCGSFSIFTTGVDAKRDIWIAILLASFLVIPMMIVFARIQYLYPNKDLLDIIQICFGKWIGKGIIVILIWYTYFWASDVLFNLGTFIEVVSLSETPRIVLVIFLSILCCWGVKEGIEVLGRWSELFLIVNICMTIIIIFLLIPEFKINNILPILNEKNNFLLKGVLSVADLYLQIAVFMIAFSNFKEKKSSYKVYFTGLGILTLFTLGISLVNILVIGINEITTNYYPTYTTMTRIDIGNVLQRLEVIIGAIFVLGIFVKVSILILCTSKGIMKVFELTDYRFLATPVVLLIINLSYFQYDSAIHYFEFNIEIWPYYFFPIQVILPVIVLIVAEIKNKLSL